MFPLTRRGLASATSLVSLLALAACADPIVSYQDRGIDDGTESAINAGYAAGSMPMPYLQLPKLREMQDMHQVEAGADSKEKLRIPAIREAALAYGIPAGLSWGTQQINQRLNQRAATLGTVYNFQTLAISGPGGQLVLPPVISEMDSTYETSDGEQTIRIADKSYEITRKAQFTMTTPLWQSYLLRSYKMPGRPSNDDLPKNDMEQSVWAEYVAEGFQEGVKQSRDILHQDLAVLKRDFEGMVLYRRLLNEGKVSAPIVAETAMGITGNGNSARYNDRQMTISAQSRLNVDHPSDIHAGVSSLDATQASTPAGEAPANVPAGDVQAPEETPDP